MERNEPSLKAAPRGLHPPGGEVTTLDVRPEPQMPRVPHPRFVVFLILLVCGVVGTAIVWPPERALVISFDFAAAVFILSSLPLMRDDSAEDARTRGARDDGGRVLLLIVTFVSFACVLAATGLMFAGRNASSATSIMLSLATLIVSWIFANLVFAFHYSHIYYDQIGGKDRKGLDFPGTDEPHFSDFVYFSFVIGMTCQVSDVCISDTALRQTVTAHAVAAFFFNLGVLALAVNFSAGFLSDASGAS